MTKQGARRIGAVISVVGGVAAVALGYATVTNLFLVHSTGWDYAAFAIASTLLAVVGALPGAVIGRALSPRAAASAGAVPPTGPQAKRGPEA